MMNLPESAYDAFLLLREQVADPSQTPFFIENQTLAELVPAALDVANLMVARSLMLVADAQSYSDLLMLVYGEQKELLHANGHAEMVSESGDLGFFAILSGMLFWDELGDDQRQYLLDMVSLGAIAVGGLSNLTKAISQVVKTKDTVNYPVDFLQINVGETECEASVRLERTVRIYRELRGKLNGEWSGGNLRKELSEYLAREGEDPHVQDLIWDLFVISNPEMIDSRLLEQIA